jgi:hypothetical protein
MLLEVVGDLLAEPGSLVIGGPEVDAGPHSGIDEQHMGDLQLDFFLDLKEHSPICPASSSSS